MAGLDAGADYVVRTNLLGAHHCLEFARKRDAQLVFLSTSRVYPVEQQNALNYREEGSRFELEADQPFLASPSRASRAVSARRRTNALRRDQAGGRAADYGVRGCLERRRSSTASG